MTFNIEEVLLTPETAPVIVEKIQKILEKKYIFLDVCGGDSAARVDWLEEPVFFNNKLNSVDIVSDFGIRFIGLGAAFVFGEYWFYVRHNAPAGNILEWHFYKNGRLSN